MEEKYTIFKSSDKKNIKIPNSFIALCSNKVFNKNLWDNYFDSILNLIEYYKKNNFQEFYFPKKPIKFYNSDYKINDFQLKILKEILIDDNLNSYLYISQEIGLQNFIKSIAGYFAFWIKSKKYNFEKSKKKKNIDQIMKILNDEV